MSFKKHILAASAWLSAAQAIIGPEHTATSPAHGFGPKPEADIHLVSPPEPTPRAMMRGVGIMERQASGQVTCGYIRGIAASAYACREDLGAICRYNSVASAVGCCLPENCNIWTACLPSTASLVTSTANMDRTRYCSNPFSPHCAVLQYPSTGSFASYTIAICDSVSTTYSLFETPTNVPAFPSSTPDVSDPISFAPVTSSSSSTPAPTGPNNNNPSGNPSNPIPPGGISNPPAPPPSSEPSSTPIGAIVGGVVGGVAALGLLGLGAFFLLRKRNNDQPPAGPSTATSPNPPPVQPNGGTPQMNMYPPQQQPQQGYPPPMQDHQAYNAAYGAYAPHRDSLAKPPGMVPYGPVPDTPSTGISPGVSPGSSPPPLYGYPNVPPGQQQQPMHHPQSMYAPPPQQYQAYQPQPQPQQHVSELPVQRGDGQLHEVSG